MCATKRSEVASGLLRCRFPHADLVLIGNDIHIQGIKLSHIGIIRVQKVRAIGGNQGA